MALSGVICHIGQSSLDKASPLLPSLVVTRHLQAAIGEVRASVGQVGLDLEDEIPVLLCGSIQAMLKSSHHSQEAETVSGIRRQGEKR